MAAAGAVTRVPTRRTDRTPRLDRPARSLVAIRHRDCRTRRGMGIAASSGAPLMGLWKQISRFFGGAPDYAKLENVQRILVEADFGVAATNETVERLSRE